MFKSMKRIIKWAGKYKGRLYLGSVFSFFSSLSTAIPTMAAAYALDKAIAAYWAGNTIESSLIWQTLWIIVGSIALNFLLSYLRAVLQESIGYEVAAGQRIHLGDVLKRVPLGYFSKNSVGDILTGVTTELSTLELQGMKMVDIIINGYAKFIAILLCFLFLSPAAAVISVVGVAFSSLALHGISRHSEKTAAITHQAMEDMSGSAIEYIRGLSIVKSFGQEGASIESFRKANTDLKNIHIKVEKGYTPFNCLHLFSLKLASMGIVFICAWQTLNGQMSLGKLSGLVGIVCNVCLAGSKLAVGKLAGSMSITADGLNNLSDAASSIVTLTGFKLAEKPADKEHPYGHARFEYLASLTVAVMILFIGFELAKSSLEKVLHPVTVEFSLLSMIVLIASILVKAEMMIFNTRMGKRIDSTTLLATAADSRNDVLTTTAVLIAALVEHATGWKVDGIMGILVAVFILWSGIGLARDTISRFSGRCEIRLSKRTDTGDHDVSDGTWLS